MYIVVLMLYAGMYAYVCVCERERVSERDNIKVKLFTPSQLIYYYYYILP
jgi:hypothetical protein